MTTVMSDELGLLAAILHDPDNDAPRLIHADWLEEQGRSVEARYIRTCLELAVTPTHGDQPDCAACASSGNCDTCGGSGELYGNYFAEDGMETCPDCRDGACSACGGPPPNPRFLELQRTARGILWPNDLQFLQTVLPGQRFDMNCRHEGAHGSFYRVRLYGPDPLDDTYPRTFLAEFQRGYLAHITCKLRTWTGDLCRACWGGPDRGVYRDPQRGPCPACAGTGQIGGIGPPLVARQPVLSVRTEKCITEYSGGVLVDEDNMSSDYYRQRGEIDCVVPHRIHRLLQGFLNPTGPPPRGGYLDACMRYYVSQDAAQRALSDAILRHTRRLVFGHDIPVRFTERPHALHCSSIDQSTFGALLGLR